MKKILISTFFASLVVLAGSGAVSAQDDGMLIIPVELFTCTYNNRQDADDLDNVITSAGFEILDQNQPRLAAQGDVKIYARRQVPG